MRRICTICARGGSKGVPSKNIRLMAGHPLIAHSIRQARDSKLFDLIAVSSDSQDILNVAAQYGADELILRPPELAQDDSPKIPVIRHCVSVAEARRAQEYDTFVDLDATSPLRTVADIDAAVIMFEASKTSNLITAMPARRSPYFNLVELNDLGVPVVSKKLSSVVIRRQDSPKCYDMNASIYIWTRQSLFEENSVFQSDTSLYVMPEERSIDIDSETDWKIVEMLMLAKAS